MFIFDFFYRYTKKRYFGKSNEDEMRHGYPTFVDMMGFQNDENVNEFLENVFEGHVREGTEFNRPQEQRYQSQCIIRYNFKHESINMY